jgi:hypothetical protein
MASVRPAMPPPEISTLRRSIVRGPVDRAPADVAGVRSFNRASSARLQPRLL